MKKTKRKGFNFFRSYYDVYNELSDKDKLSFIEALLDKQFLGINPEGLEGMAKFAWISQVNSIDSQVKGYEDKTGVKLTPTLGGVNTPTQQVQVQVEEKVKEKVQDVKFVFKKSLLDYGFKKELVEDWLKVRKTKKSTNTETAFKGFIKEVKKSGKDINEILKTCIEKSWSGFKSDWITSSSNNTGKKATSRLKKIQGNY